MRTLDKISELLKIQNKKQKDLTDYLGISKNVFTDWKSGRNESYLKYLPQIAEFFNVSVDYLLGNTDTPISIINNDFSEQEKRLVAAYRNKPEMKSAVDKLLGLDDKIIKMEQPEKTYKIRSIARGGHITEFELDEQGIKDFEESAKKTDASDL